MKMAYSHRNPRDPFDVLACIAETIITPKIVLYVALAVSAAPYTQGASVTVVLPIVLLTYGVADIIKQWQKNH